LNSEVRESFCLATCRGVRCPSICDLSAFCRAQTSAPCVLCSAKRGKTHRGLKWETTEQKGKEKKNISLLRNCFVEATLMNNTCRSNLLHGRTE